MLTERGSGLVGAAVLLYLASRAFGVAELQLAAVAALALLAAALLFVWTTSATLDAVRFVRPGRLHFDAEAAVEVTVRNTGRLPTATLELHDHLPLVLGGGGSVTVPPLAPGARVTLTTPLRGQQRGRFTVGPLRVRLRDPFGLIARSRDLPGTAEVIVYPPVWALPAGLPLGGANSTGGEGTPRPLASGEDRSTVREYVQGDDLRAVHWASTAHRGKLMVRQAEAPQDPRACVLVDVRADRHHGHGPGASIEAAVAAAASVTFHLADRGRGVVVIDGPLTSAPRARSAEAWLEHLAVVEPRPVDLPAVLQQLGQGLAGDGALVAVLTVPDPVELQLLVRTGRAFTSRVALLIDAERYGGRGARQVVDPVATADRLRAAGWRVTVVGPGDRLDLHWRELVVARPAMSGTAGGGLR
ncbi:MAG: DUF58 domain-containing protein [Nitriliruptor sp.]|uniref:DUF58 domain-containing protein n=1 Tax=Nitriliruptor sp. TaxID=2448056 RepID=UPI0034A08BAA